MTNEIENFDTESADETASIASAASVIMTAVVASIAASFATNLVIKKLDDRKAKKNAEDNQE